MRQSRGARLARAAAAAGIATFTALVSHVAAGGAVPQLIGIAAPFVLSLMVCLVLVGRRLSLLGLSASVAVTQILFHALFVLGAGGTTLASAGTAGHGHHHGSLTVSGGDGMATAMVADTAMWLGHGIAAAVTIVALYLGERAIAASAVLLRLVRLWVLRAIVLPVVGRVRPARLTVAAHDLAHLLSQILGASQSRRGPPAPLSV